MGEVEGLSDISMSRKKSTGDAVTYLALGELWLDVWPGFGLRSVGKEVHDDGSLGDGLVDVKEVLALNPTILCCLFPAGAALAHTNNDIEPVVAEVEPLSVALRAVSDEGECVVLEVVL